MIHDATEVHGDKDGDANDDADELHPTETQIRSQDGMTFEEKMHHWRTLDIVQAPDPTTSESIADNEELYDFPEEDMEYSEVDLERINFVLSTPQFDWLLAAVQCRLQLDYSEAFVLGEIKRTTTSVLSYHRGNRALRTQSVVIDLPWSPESFIESQEYQTTQSIFTALTISGSVKRAQLLSCRQYAKQTWPIIGESIIEGLVSMSSKPSGVVTTSKCCTTSGVVSEY
jgi:hypothetical protein